jgi:L-fucose mutarotase/ribose pyranase (RbsD/FucU family)
MSSLKPAVVTDWEQRLNDLLPLYGHRNWVVIADSAYPSQSNPGIETIVADAAQIDVVQKVSSIIASHKHVRPNVYTDLELRYVPESDAPGIDLYRQQLATTLAGSHPQQLPHDQIIAKLDKAAQVFHVLIIKTNMTVPYTTVFFELDCDYWPAEAEQRLRQAMQKDRTL